MNDIKKTIIFDEVKEQQAESKIKTHHLFSEKEKFQLSSLEEEQEQQITEVLAPSKKRWGIRLLALSGVGLLGWQTVDNILTAIATSDWLSIGWSGFILGLSTLGISAIGREFIALRRLRGRQDERAKLNEIIEQDGIGKAKRECLKLAKQSQSELSPGFDKWQHSLAQTHNDKEVFELYDRLVLKEQDVLATKLVAKHASEAALMVAISPLAIADMLLVAWRNLRMLDQLAKIYALPLGYMSRIQLLKIVLTNMAIAGSSEIVSDVSADLLSVGIAGKLSARAAQGLGVGILSARLGFKAINLMRPLPYIGTQAPKLSDVRKELLEKLTN